MKAPLSIALLVTSPWLPAFAQDAPPPEPEPEPERGLVSRSEGALPGYTLFTPLMTDDTYLVDLNGEVVHEWKADAPAGQSVYLLDSGRLLRTTLAESPIFRGGGLGGRLVEYDWDGTVTWDYPISDEERCSHHDAEPLPNGNVLVIAWEVRTRRQALAAGRDPAHLGAAGMWPDCVLEIEPIRPDGGKVVWEWHMWDHLIQDFDPEREHHGDVTAHPERLDVNFDQRRNPPISEQERRRLAEVEARMRALGYVGDDDDEKEEADDPRRREPRQGLRGATEWMHTNSVAHHPELDLVVLSSRHMEEVWVIDHSTTTEEARGSSGGRWGRGGDLLYRWGNPKNYGAGTVKDQQLFEQHDATFVGGPDDLRLLIFNNGGGRPDGDWSSVDEVLLPFDPERGFLREEGKAFGPSEPTWSYAAAERESFYSSFISGAQRLSNGNTLICSGVDGRLFEVTREQEIVWEFRNPHRSGARSGLHGPPPGGPHDRSGARDRRPDRPPPGAPPGRGGPGRPGGPRGGNDYSLFRGTRIAPDHPGLAGKEL